MPAKTFCTLGGVEVPVNHEIQIKQRFSITKQERCTQYEEFNAL